MFLKRKLAVRVGTVEMDRVGSGMVVWGGGGSTLLLLAMTSSEHTADNLLTTNLSSQRYIFMSVLSVHRLHN
jgi:hypothetical protein